MVNPSRLLFILKPDSRGLQAKVKSKVRKKMDEIEEVKKQIWEKIMENKKELLRRGFRIEKRLSYKCITIDYDLEPLWEVENWEELDEEEREKIIFEQYCEEFEDYLMRWGLWTYYEFLADRWEHGDVESSLFF